MENDPLASFLSKQLITTVTAIVIINLIFRHSSLQSGLAVDPVV